MNMFAEIAMVVVLFVETGVNSRIRLMGHSGRHDRRCDARDLRQLALVVCLAGVDR